MTKLCQTFSLRFSPDSSGFEVADGSFVLHATVPYNDKGLTIQINPAVSEYIESKSTKNITIKNLTITEDTGDTKKLYISFEHNDKKVEINDKKYIFKLQGVDKYQFEDQEFPEYNLFIEECE